MGSDRGQVRGRYRWQRSWLLLLPLIVVALAWYVRGRPSSADLSLERVRQAGVLVVGVDPSYPPFEADDGHGHLVGFDIDLATEVAHQMGVEVRFVTIDFGSIVDALEVGQFDAIIGGVSPFPEYARELAYSNPYFDDGLVLVTHRSAASMLLGVESGSDADLNQQQLRAALPGYQWQQFDDQDEIHLALTRGQIGAAIVDAVTASRWVQGSSVLVARPSHLTSAPFVIAVRRSDQKLLAALNARIDALRTSGEVSRLEQRWLVE